jgi:hypothetical protein
MTKTLSPLELLAKLVCESAGARFIGVEKAIPGHSAHILFCAANVPDEMQTTCALPIFECSTHSVRERLQQALEAYCQQREAE